jgi:hypothetical protein
MKSNRPLLAVALVAITALCLYHLLAAETPTPSGYEYATIRWGGKENTHIIRPGGQVEFIGLELRKAPKPERTDDRAFYMNLAMNGLTKEGYEFAGMTPDEIVMKRPVAK